MNWYEIIYNFLFISNKKQENTEEQKHTLVLLATVPYQVLEVTDETFVIARGEERDLLLCDRVKHDPITLDCLV